MLVVRRMVFGRHGVGLDMRRVEEAAATATRGYQAALSSSHAPWQSALIPSTDPPGGRHRTESRKRATHTTHTYLGSQLQQKKRGFSFSVIAGQEKRKKRDGLSCAVCSRPSLLCRYKVPVYGQHQKNDHVPSQQRIFLLLVLTHAFYNLPHRPLFPQQKRDEPSLHPPNPPWWPWRCSARGPCPASAGARR